MRLLENKNVIITGTSRGIGFEILKEFAINGANIWAHTRKMTKEFEAACNQLAAENNVEIRPIIFEVTDYDTVKGVVKQIMSSKIPIDALVNNAGVTYNALFQMSRMKEVRNQMEVNFFAPFIFTQYISKLMVRNKRGSIINIASTAAIDGNSGKAAYGASKAALITMTKVIAEEMGKDGIRANCIAPGMIETQMLNTMSETIIENTKLETDLRRIGMPVDIANTAVFLASDLSSYLTGQVIRVDGGMS